jgi:hypothetical protein
VSVAVLLDKFIKTSDRLCEEELKQKREVKQSKETVKYILDPLLELLTAVSNDQDDNFSINYNGIFVGVLGLPATVGFRFWLVSG